MINLWLTSLLPDTIQSSKTVGVALVCQRENELPHGFPGCDRFLDSHIRSTWIRQIMVLVVGMKSTNELNRTQEVLDCSQSRIVAVLECIVSTVLICDTLSSTPTI